MDSSRATPTAASKKQFLEAAAKLPRSADRAIAMPLGGSTFRALMVGRRDDVLDHFEAPHPADHYLDAAHAIAAALLHFGSLPVAGAAFLAGMVPKRGRLRFTNLAGWPPFDRDVTMKHFGFATEWLNDGTAGYYGLPRMSGNDFAILRKGQYRTGDTYIYAIFGTGMNVGCPVTREDSHLLFVPRTDEDRAMQMWLKKFLGHLPDWEDITSGGMGMRNVAEYYLDTDKVSATDPYATALRDHPAQRRGEIVTAFALRGHPSAKKAAQMAFTSLGSWLGAMAVSHQALRIDLSPGILADPEMREFCLHETNFLAAFVEQGRPMFREFVEDCTVRICLRNPEHEGAVERAAELLHQHS